MLLAGLLVYTLSSFLCAQANSIELLILFRITQALGAGGMVSVSTAIVKDSFSDDERPNIIALLQMLGTFAPTVAPLLGAQIIKHFHWQYTFDLLGFISIASIIITCFYKETLPIEKGLKGNVLESIKSLQDITANKAFIAFLIGMGGTSIIYMSFLAVSSYIYMDWFNLSETTYSIFFAINSLILIIGPKIYVSVKEKLSAKQIINISFIAISISALLLLSIGKTSPYLFMLSFAPITFSAGFLRSFSSNILLGQENMNAGGALSVINFSNTAMGS